MTSLLQVRVPDVANDAPELRVAVAHLGVDGGGVQAEARVALEIPELGGVGHADEPQPAFEDPRLHRTDPREAVRAQGRQHAQVAGGGMATAEDGGDPRRALGELAPCGHGMERYGRPPTVASRTIGGGQVSHRRLVRPGVRSGQCGAKNYRKITATAGMNQLKTDSPAATVRDATNLLHVDVEHLARCGVLVPTWLALGLASGHVQSRSREMP